MTMRRLGDTKYTLLVRYLQSLPPEQATVTLTLAEVEAVIAATLPPGARLTAFWRTGSSVRTQIRRTGWRAALTPTRDAVTFTRLAP